MTNLAQHLGPALEIWSAWMRGMAWQVLLLCAVVWLLAGRGRWLSAGARHLLWLLIFIKLVTPPALSSPWSVGNILGRYDIRVERVDQEAYTEAGLTSAGAAPGTPATAGDTYAAVLPGSLAAAAFAGWAAVAGFLLLLMFAQYCYHTRKVMSALTAPGEEARRLFEEEKQRLNVRAPVSLFVSEKMVSPGVFGLISPMVVLPSPDFLRREDLRAVMAHELAHVKRRDIAAGWLSMGLSCLYWFHPAVWLANLYLRREREMACDDMVLRSSTIDGGDYASTILSVAQKCSCRAPVGAGMLGILEYSDNLMARVRSCADASRARKVGLRAMGVIAAVLLALPMADWQAHAAVLRAAGPMVVATSPPVGASEVDPATAEITVTFNQDMDTRGYSWTGGGEYFPDTPFNAYWRDSRTCVLPVSLKQARFYRVGINSSWYQSFQSKEGVPALPIAIYFTTRGASNADVAALAPPQVVSLEPAHGSTVAPGTVQSVVTFDRPMDTGGMSYVIMDGKRNFPAIVGKPEWSDDGRSITAQFSLEPRHTYTIGLNSQYHVNFTSDHGVPLEPVVWSFNTTGAANRLQKGETQ